MIKKFFKTTNGKRRKTWHKPLITAEQAPNVESIKTWYELLIPTNQEFGSEIIKVKGETFSFKSIGTFKTQEEAMFISAKTPKNGVSRLRPIQVIPNGKIGFTVKDNREIIPIDINKKYNKEFQEFLKRISIPALA